MNADEPADFAKLEKLWREKEGAMSIKPQKILNRDHPSQGLKHDQMMENPRIEFEKAVQSTLGAFFEQK